MAERECYITTGRGGESQEKTTSGLTHSLGWHKHTFTLAWQKSVKCECTKMNGKNRNWNGFFFVCLFLSKANPGWKRKDKSFSRLTVNIAVGTSAKLQPRLSLSPVVILQTIQKALRDPLADDACRINTHRRAWSITNLIIINVGLSASVRSADSRATPWELQNGVPSEFGRAFLFPYFFGVFLHGFVSLFIATKSVVFFVSFRGSIDGSGEGKIQINSYSSPYLWHLISIRFMRRKQQWIFHLFTDWKRPLQAEREKHLFCEACAAQTKFIFDQTKHVYCRK